MIKLIISPHTVKPIFQLVIAIYVGLQIRGWDIKAVITTVKLSYNEQGYNKHL